MAASRSFFDTNIVIYAYQAADPRADLAARCLAGGGVVSVQVLAEFIDVARRKLRMSWPQISAAMAAIEITCPKPVPVTIETHHVAVAIAEQTGARIYDAQIIASALEAGCDTLWTEDLQNGRVIAGRLTIRNPFVA
jgi:predicted nucleic acid-binding protein